MFTLLFACTFLSIFIFIDITYNLTNSIFIYISLFPGNLIGKESACKAGDPRDRLPTPVFLGFPCGSAGRVSTCNVGHPGSIPGLGRSPGEGKGYPLQYSGLENSMDSIVHGVPKGWTRLNDFHSLACEWYSKAGSFASFTASIWNSAI